MSSINSKEPKMMCDLSPAAKSLLSAILTQCETDEENGIRNCFYEITTDEFCFITDSDRYDVSASADSISREIMHGTLKIFADDKVSHFSIYKLFTSFLFNNDDGFIRFSINPDIFAFIPYARRLLTDPKLPNNMILTF